MNKKITINLKLKNKDNIQTIKHLQKEIEILKKELQNKVSVADFDDFKTIINGRFQVYDTKLKELENLVNLDEETIKQIKEIIANLPDYQGLLDKINRLNAIGFGFVLRETGEPVIKNLTELASLVFGKEFDGIYDESRQILGIQLTDKIKSELVSDIAGINNILVTKEDS